MADPVRSADDENPSVPAASREGGLVFDYAFRSPKLVDVEEALSNVGTSHKLSPIAQDRSLDGKFRLHALGNLALFDLRFGCGIDAELAPHEVDDRVAFAMPMKGRTLLQLRRREFAASERCGVIIPSGPPATIRFTEDCETRTIVMSRFQIAEHCTKLLGREIRHSVDFETTFPLDGEDGQNWLRLVEYAALELSSPLSLARRWPTVGQRLEQMVMTGFMLAASDSTATTTFYSGVAGIVLMTPLLPWIWTTPPSALTWFLLAMTGAFGGFGHWLLVLAHARAPAAILSPFIYTQIIWMLALGYILFGDWPDPWTFAGGGIVIASGLYLLYRERVRHQEPEHAA